MSSWQHVTKHSHKAKLNLCRSHFALFSMHFHPLELQDSYPPLRKFWNQHYNVRSQVDPYKNLVWYYIPLKICQTQTTSDDLILFANTPAQAEYWHHKLKQAAEGIGFYVNTDKTEFMCLKQDGDISTLNGKPLKLFDYFTYLGSNIPSTKIYVNIYREKTWNAIDRLLII